MKTFLGKQFLPSFALALSLCVIALGADLPPLELRGIQRTKPSFIKKLTEICFTKIQEGKAEIPLPELEQCLLDSKLFSRTRAFWEKETLILELEERWTLIPIPYVRAQEDSRSVGLFLMESNFAGMGKMVGAGGSFGSNGKTFFLMARDPSVLFSAWFASGSFRIQKEDFYRYEGEDKKEGVRERESSFDFSLGRKITHEWSVSLRGSHQRKQYEGIPSYSFSSFASSERIWGLGPFVSYNLTHFKFYFQEGFSAWAGLTRQLSKSSGRDLATTTFIQGDYQRNLVKDHALQFQAAFHSAEGGDVADLLKIGGKTGLRGVPFQGIWTQRAFHLALDYQVPFFHQGYGVWTVAPFVDNSWIKFANKPSSVVMSYGGGLYLFLKKLAIPGVGIIFGHNPDYQGTFASFFLGRSF